VRWVWSPNTLSSNSPQATATYPGDAYVDWLGIDAYNVGASKGWDGWQSLADLLEPAYTAITHLSNKPLMIAETATTEHGGDKAAWIRRGLLLDAPARFPRVRAVVWFDKNRDWRVDSSPASLAAFRTVVASPLYHGNVDVDNPSSRVVALPNHLARASTTSTVTSPTLPGTPTAPALPPPAPTPTAPALPADVLSLPGSVVSVSITSGTPTAPVVPTGVPLAP